MTTRAAAAEDWFADDPALGRFLALYEDAATLKAAEPWLARLGQAAPAQLDQLAREADKRRPVLTPGAGPGGQDTVRYDPSYRALQRHARELRAFTLAWHPLGEHARAPRTLHFALGYLFAQAEAGYYCPGCMTDGAAFVLERHAAAPLRDWTIPKLTQLTSEGAWEGAMLLTEKTGGSDVGTTSTTATANPDGTFRLTGAKWFASNCTAEVILTLARMPGARSDPSASEPRVGGGAHPTAAGKGTEGLGLFLVPRFLPPAGKPNTGIVLTKLKDKLGTCSMATAELELHGATAFLLAGEGKGFRAMAEMVNLSRLYNAVASVAGARRAVREGLTWGKERMAFGKRLVDQPLYRLSLTGYAIEVEGALAVVLEASNALDRAAKGDAEGAALARSVTPLAKSCTAKLAVRAASEACEWLGGNGYVEDQVTPRLLRDAQVLPIWEGTTNIQSLDLLRVARKEPGLPALHQRAAELVAEACSEPALVDAARTVEGAWTRLGDELRGLATRSEDEQQASAWRLVQAHYHAFAASLLLRAAARAQAGSERTRAVVVAQAYVARFVAPAGSEGERRFEALALQHGLQVLGVQVQS